MDVEIVMIGTELLLGQIVDTNATHMGQVLAEYGINLYQKTTVGDNPARIKRVLEAALERSDAVLTSGGLGPTEDDITRECVAEVTGRPLEYRQELYDRLVARFARVGRTLTENNKKQAYAPRGSIAVENPNGTAPGLIVEDPRGLVICMPGVPRELHAMLAEHVIPFLRERFDLEGLVHYRVLKVCGIGESRVDSAIGDLITSLDNPKIGLLASPDAVKIRISARAACLEDATRLIAVEEAKVRERLPGLVMGVDDETLEGVVDRLLADRGWTLALAETHTGGMIGQRFLAAGARQVAGGLVTAPWRLEGEDLAAAARRLAEEAQNRYETDCALALAAEGTTGKAVALFSTPDGPRQWEIHYARTDELSQLRSAIICLEHVRRFLVGIDEDRTDPRI